MTLLASTHERGREVMIDFRPRQDSSIHACIVVREIVENGQIKLVIDAYSYVAGLPLEFRVTP